MKIYRTAIVTFGLIYILFAALPPAALWFWAGEVRILDTEQGQAPRIEYTREIYRPASISYAVVVWNADTRSVGCDGGGGPFTYQPMRGPLVGKDLVWWANSPLCGELPVGTYWAETCWKIEAPARALLPGFLKDLFGWLLPPKRICRISPPFEIY